eukprot:8946501-Pyramimonas_sp.AAC.1
MVHYLHQSYSRGAELWDDGNILTVDFKLAAPPDAQGGPAQSTRKQGGENSVCVCAACPS